jgi:hypothetical protein
MDERHWREVWKRGGYSRNGPHWSLLVEPWNIPAGLKTIAGLVNEGRFSYPYIPTGMYAEIRNLLNDYEVYKNRMDDLM